MAAVLASVPVFGFGLPCAYATWYFADHGEVWSFLGFPTYGEGPFTDIGIETTTALLVAFLVVCVAELVVGWMLWQGRRAAVMSSLALLPDRIRVLDRLCAPAWSCGGRGPDSRDHRLWVPVSTALTGGSTSGSAGSWHLNRHDPFCAYPELKRAASWVRCGFQVIDRDIAAFGH